MESDRIVRKNKLADAESIPPWITSTAMSAQVAFDIASPSILRDATSSYGTNKRFSQCESYFDESGEVSLTDLVDYQWLVGAEAERWLLEFADSSDAPHTIQQQLRKSLTAERARLIAQQISLRTKAIKKFGDLAGRMFFTDLGLQQSTDRWIAAYKAGRFSPDKAIIDYCCGIGGDLMALASHSRTIGWDRDPRITLFAEANLRAANMVGSGTVSIGSVEQHPPAEDSQWHLDPDRRIDGRRSTHIEFHSPDEATIRSWLALASKAAIKLAPAARLSNDWQEMAELEWISRGGECRQLVAWFGDLGQSPGKRRATIISTIGSHSFEGHADAIAPMADEIGEFVYDTDPAIRAAGLTSALASALGGATLSEGAAYLTSDEPLTHPLLSSFRVEEVLPFRIRELANHVQTKNLGEIEIKVRGVSVRPEELRKKLKLAGSGSATLLLTRHGKREIAILARRVSGVTPPDSKR